MKAETLLHQTLKENGFEDFVTKGSGFSRTIVQAMERFAIHAVCTHPNIKPIDKKPKK